LAVAMTVIVAVPSVAHARKKPPTLTIPLRIKVASCPDKAGKLVPVRDDKWVKKHLKAARKLFSRHGIQLMEIVEPFTPARCTLLTRAHRYAAAADMAMDGKATVLVFKRVRDVDVLTYNLMGVHWRYRGKDAAHKGKRWVFLTARAKIPVLAHELCHFFGLPHDKAGGNLMTPGPSDPIYKDKDSAKPAGFKAVLTGAQVKRLRRGIKRFLKTGM
jgi:hypothetical protein